MNRMRKIRFIGYLSFIFLFTVNAFAQQSNAKIGYFELKRGNVPAKYNYLAASLPRSLRSVLRKSGFASVQTRGIKINEIYDRQEAIRKGRRTGAELVICGSYTVIDAQNEIQFYVLVYDVKAGELVLQRRLVGKTGTQMFDMIDKAANYLKSKIVAYLDNRAKMLALAKKKREARNNLSEAERRRKLQEETERSTVNIDDDGVSEDPGQEQATEEKSGGTGMMFGVFFEWGVYGWLDLNDPASGQAEGIKYKVFGGFFNYYFTSLLGAGISMSYLMMSGSFDY